MKTCKACGSMNLDDATKCTTCNYDFGTIDLNNATEETIEYTKCPIWTYISLVVSLILIGVYTFYININDDYQFAPVIFPLLICAVLIICYYWFNLLMNNRKALKIQRINDQRKADLEKAALAGKAQKSDSFSYKLKEMVMTEKSAYNEPVFNHSLSCMDAVDLLRSGSLTSDEDGARSLLAALASRRAIVICTSTEDEVNRIQSMLASLTGIQPPLMKINQICNSSRDLFVTSEEDSSNCLPSEVSCNMAMAYELKKQIVPIILSFSYADGLDKTFFDMKDYLGTPFGEGSLILKNVDPHSTYQSVKFHLPANVRLILLFTPDQAYRIPSAVMKKCTLVDLREGTYSDSKVFEAGLSYDRLFNLFGNSADEYCLSEESWKKIDALIAYINEYGEFSVDNKFAVAMENFVCVYMASGANEMQALDALLASMLIPGAIRALDELISEEKPSISQYIDVNFGLENLPLASEILKKFSDA